MKLLLNKIALCALSVLICCGVANAAEPMKAVWVSTYLNIDWPSKPGLSKETQIAEFQAIVDRAKQTGFNTIILQVRSEYDAIYPSKLEPWSRFLTGKSGGDPGYDPLATAISITHSRGLKFHAWVNPYRAGQAKLRNSYASSHISGRMPGEVVSYDQYLWCDPSSASVRRHTLAVIADIVKRYDIDGLHYDDYFYPYPKKGVAFPDQANFKASGGRMSLSDWRRNNINEMVRDIYSTVKAARSGCEVGISPFGIWKPGNPPGVTGMNQYEELFADPKLWMERGWCDYIVPQLYWSLDSKGQPFEQLLKWWCANAGRTRVVAGLGAYRINESKWPASEIVNQINVCNKTRGCKGYAVFSMKVLMKNSGGLATALSAK